MADISKVTTLDGTTYDIKDASARAALDEKMPIVTYGTPTVIVDTTTVSFSKDGDNSWYISGTNPISGMTFAENVLYTVTWDGTDYDLFYAKAFLLSSSNNGDYDFDAVGNLGVVSHDSPYATNAPFLITKHYKQTESSNVYILTSGTEAQHTIKVTATPYTKTVVDKQLYEITKRGRATAYAGSGDGSTIMNYGAVASGEGAVALNHGTKATGAASSATGICTKSTGIASHSSGINTTASGTASYAGGTRTTASGPYTHTEGSNTAASGYYGHAEGYYTNASGDISHVEGNRAVASGQQSHAEGKNTIANHASQHVFGEFNTADASDAAASARGNYVEIVGNGTADDARSNARTLDWNGNEVLAGKLTVGAAPTNNMDVATKQYVDNCYTPASATPLMDGTAAVGTSVKYAREDHRHPVDTSRAAATHTHSTQQLYRPSALRGLNDITLQPLVNSARANRLAFLPGDQIIIEKTTDGGTTWVDAGFSDSAKLALFSETRPGGINLPQINGVRNILCGLRVTISAMKYNVPAGTTETQKYNYWSSEYINKQERYCQLKEFYFWVSTSNDSMSVKIERATGGKPNNWQKCFEDSSYYLTGWSGCDYVKLDSQSTFGGGTNQTGNHWNYRLTFMTRGVNGTETMNTGYETQYQSLMEIRGYGDTWWGRPNEYMANDKIYTHDSSQNVTFPAKVTATSFAGALTGNVTGNLSGTATTATNVSAEAGTVNSARHVWFSDNAVETKRAYDDDFKYNPSTNTVSANITGSVNGHTVNSDVPSNATWLPSVSASDNGKILRVVSGAWSAVNLPSASGVSF